MHAPAMPLLRTLPANTVGRDFVVSDLHGHFAALEQALAAQAFDPARDRVLAVGDLIDRGPASARALEFLAQPWFHSVRGNHEQALLDWLDPLLAGAPAAAVREAAGRHFAIGGDWALPLLMAALRGEQDEARCWQQALATLPLALQARVREREVGIVHASVPGADWAFFASDAPTPREQYMAMWSRRPLDDGAEGSSGVAGIDLVFAGHNTVPALQRSGNFCMIETAVWAGNALTLVDIDMFIARDQPQPGLLARLLGKRGPR